MAMTTLSVLIAAELVRLGNDVLLVDGDPQGSTQKWHKKSDLVDEWPTVVAFKEPILHKKKQIVHHLK